ncbi:MAG: DNRLRE domain-containing protein, partial [Anaerolineae bacterium]
MTTTKKRLTWGVVLMAVLVAVGLAVVALLGKPAVLAQAEETQLPLSAEEMVAGPLADGVDPFVMTFTAYRDTWVDQAHPDTNYGGDLDLILNTQTGAAAFVLLSFNLSALPADAQVVGATLSAYSMDTTSDNYPILPYAATSSWEEPDVTWNSRPGTLHLGDLPAKHVPEDWTEFQVTKIVQAWRDGSQPNYGIALRADTGASGSRTYMARKTAMPPKLTVYYTRRAELVAVADTWIGYAEPDTPHGSDTTLSVISADNALQEAHALLAFDFASLPSDIEVISATLGLYSVMNRQAAGADAVLVADLYASAILESWDEATTTWNNAPAHVALGDPPTSYVLAPDRTEWDVSNIVGVWASGYLEPHGILLRVGPETADGYNFWSREQPEPPKLVIAYGAAPPTCKPITSLQVNGATAGLTGVDYTFDMVYYPTDADPPDSIVWTATDHAGQFSGPSVTLSWSTPGEKTIWVEATHCGGTTSTSHTITLSEPPVGCDYPVTGLALSGPLVVTSGTGYEFLASASPYNATLLLTFIWEATEMAPATMVVDQRATYKSYNWPTTGSKTIAVTAENCGGSIVAYHSVEVVESADLPDLRISTAWIDLDQDRIYYIIHNGGSTAVPPGFYVALNVGSSTVATTAHPTPLPAGAVGSGYLDYAWTCRGTTADVAILADWADDVVEVDEANNGWSATWACDQKPPVILTGPEVTDITETAARVEWTTDEACYGWGEYDTSPYMPRPSTTPRGTTALTAHAVNLTRLTAGTTYFVRAFCEDAAALRTNSGAVTFETAPLGTDPPVIRSLAVQQYPISLYEFWEVIVELEDAWYMDRVSCTLDGTLLGSDYSADTSGTYPRYNLYLSPYEMGLTRDQFFGQSHALSCTAYRQHPKAYATQQRNVTFSGDAAPPLRLWIHSVNNDQTIYVSGETVPTGRELDVTVDAAAYEWSCTSSSWSEGLPPGIAAVRCSNLTPLPVDSITLRIDG